MYTSQINERLKATTQINYKPVLGTSDSASGTSDGSLVFSVVVVVVVLDVLVVVVVGLTVVVVVVVGRVVVVVVVGRTVVVVVVVGATVVVVVVVGFFVVVVVVVLLVVVVVVGLGSLFPSNVIKQCF